MRDSCQRFLFKNHDVRGEFIHLEESIAAIMEQHAYPPSIQLFLSELLCASALFASSLKIEADITIQRQSQGAIKVLVAKCNTSLELRGLAQWDEAALPEILLRDLAEGELVITVFDRKTSRQYQSIVALEHGSIAQSLEHYFAQSEQLPTKLYFNSDNNVAAGLLLQALPESATPEQNSWEHLTVLSNTIKSGELLSWDAKTLLQKVYAEEDVTLFKAKEPYFHCPCSLDKMEASLKLLGKAEAMEILSTHKHIDVTCEYCSNHYEFDRKGVDRIFS